MGIRLGIILVGNIHIRIFKKDQKKIKGSQLMPKERAQSWGDSTTHMLGTVTGSHCGPGDLYTLLAD